MESRREKHHQMHCWSNLKSGKEWKERYFSSFVKNAPPPCILLKIFHAVQFYCNTTITTSFTATMGKATMFEALLCVIKLNSAGRKTHIGS